MRKEIWGFFEKIVIFSFHKLFCFRKNRHIFIAQIISFWRHLHNMVALENCKKSPYFQSPCFRSSEFLRSYLLSHFTRLFTNPTHDPTPPSYPLSYITNLRLFMKIPHMTPPAVRGLQQVLLSYGEPQGTSPDPYRRETLRMS